MMRAMAIWAYRQRALDNGALRPFDAVG